MCIRDSAMPMATDIHCMQAISTVTGLPAPAPDGEKIRKCEHGDVDAALLKWFKQCQCYDTPAVSYTHLHLKVMCTKRFYYTLFKGHFSFFYLNHQNYDLLIRQLVLSKQLFLLLYVVSTSRLNTVTTPLLHTESYNIY